MKLDQIYKESSCILKKLNKIDQECKLAFLNKKLSKERKEKLKSLEDKSFEIYNELKKKMIDDPNNFIFSIG